MSFIHLHNHTTYSFLDGFNHPDNAARKAKELGMSHLAITDHNHLDGAIDFQKACKKQQVKPILGLESYHTWDRSILSKPAEARNQEAIIRAKDEGSHILKINKKKRKKKGEEYEESIPVYDTTQYHILLLAMDQKGWQNLAGLHSEAAETCTFNARFICDDLLLEKYNENLILTTACIANTASALFINGQAEIAQGQLKAWQEIFGDRFYIEIQPLNIHKQWVANYHLIQWAKENGARIIATNDIHYTEKDDHDDHDTLLCMGMGKKKDQEDRMRYSNDFWMRDEQEMQEAFEEQAEAMAAYFDEFDKEDYLETARQAMQETQALADSLDTGIKLGADTPQFPGIEIPKPLTAEQALSMKCFQALYRYKNENPEVDLDLYSKRLHSELEVINSKGFASYMLIVHEYINWCEEQDIPVGPGRGSCAGSLALFLLGITKGVDPIKYGLMFERFLTEDRTAAPDIDNDFCYYNRQRVIDHLRDLYGEEKVSHIGTTTYLGVKSSLKDVGRTLDIDFSTMNEITKKVGGILEDPNLTFQMLDELGEYENEADQAKHKEFKALEEENPELFRLARRFEGMPRNMGVHASGILVTPRPVSSDMPTRVDDSGQRVSIYSGEQLEDLNYLKFDILGLKTLSVINLALKYIDESMGINDLYELIDLDDPEIFEMIRKRQTDGLFQIESRMFKNMISEIQPDCFEDLVAITSLGRPGPLQAGMDKAYAKRKHGDEEAKEPLLGTWDILEETFGTIIYQEQVMKIAQRVAGFDGNQADTYLRKALGKKIKEKMDLCRQFFIYGKVNEEPPEGYDPEDKDQVLYDPEGEFGAPILGGINNGYKLKTLVDFWNQLEGYAKYLFNKSHAATYSYITMMTGYLKHYYPVEFMAALLSVQDEKDDIVNYTKVAEEMGIRVLAPDINRSDRHFLPEGKKRIRMGISCIKGVGETSIGEILKNRPYTSIEQAVETLPKKRFNKNVGISMIKAGCFDFQNSNRNRLINAFYDARGDKDERLDEESFDQEECIEYEKDVIRVPITYKPWWDQVKKNKKVEAEFVPEKLTEITDKNGRLMAFVEGKAYNCSIKGVIFAQNYGPIRDVFKNDLVWISGTKDESGSFIIKKAQKVN